MNIEKNIISLDRHFTFQTQKLCMGQSQNRQKNEKEVKVGKDFDIDKLKHYSRFFSAMFLSLSPFSP